MLRPCCLSLVTLTLGVLLGATLMAPGDSIVGKPFSDEHLSLSGLKEVRLNIREMPKELEQAGLNAAEILERWTTMLQEAGLHVVDDPEAPMLSLLTLGGLDPIRDDILIFVFLLELNQRVRIERLKEFLVVPTYTKLFIGVEPLDRAEQVVVEGLEEEINHFLYIWRRTGGLKGTPSSDGAGDSINRE